MKRCQTYFWEAINIAAMKIMYASGFQRSASSARLPASGYPSPALDRLTMCSIGCVMPLLSIAPRAMPMLHPIFSSIARPLFACPISGAEPPTTSPFRTTAAVPPDPRPLPALDSPGPPRLLSSRGKKRRLYFAKTALNWASWYCMVPFFRTRLGRLWSPEPMDLDVMLKR